MSICEGYDANIRKGTSRKCRKNTMDGSCYCTKHQNVALDAYRQYPQKLPKREDITIEENLIIYNWPTKWPVIKGELRWYAREVMRKHIEIQYRKILMASRIKRRFRIAISNPEYKMCRNRLEKEFKDLSI